MIRRIAANLVILSEKERYVNHVVELQGSRIVRHYPLTGEQARTEWLTGTLLIEQGQAYHLVRLADGTQHKRPL